MHKKSQIIPLDWLTRDNSNYHRYGMGLLLSELTDKTGKIGGI